MAAAASAAAAARRMHRFVGYLRVSTDQQGSRGLGMEAQKAAIVGYVERAGGDLVGEYVEVESGKSGDRPELKKALSACQRLGARLIIAKLDRLSRSVRFIASLMDSHADFVVVDTPSASRLTLHILAAVAENEREMISRRTREALAAAKARGVKLGNPQGIAEEAAQRGRKLGQEVRQERGRRFAERMSGTVNRLRAEGLSLRAIARKLNDEGTLTPSGRGSWTATAVRRVLAR